MSPNEHTQRRGMRLATSVGLELDGPQQAADIVAQVRQAAELGLAGAWWGQLFSWDALTSLTVAGVQVPDIPLGTAVVTTYPRHPLALASQALSTQAAVGNRLTLGLGPSHQRLVESMLGIAWDRPALNVREYLQALVPLLRGEQVDFHGEIYHVSGQVLVAGAEPPPVLLAAHGPRMLQIAGELADGSIVTWAGPRVVADHVVPRLTAAAEAAGRPAPRVVVSLPISVTDDPDGAREWVAQRYAIANEMPSYKSLVDREGVTGVHDTVIVGDETAAARQLQRYADAGATDFVAVPFGPSPAVTRTLQLLADLSASSTP